MQARCWLTSRFIVLPCDSWAHDRMTSQRSILQHFRQTVLRAAVSSQPTVLFACMKQSGCLRNPYYFMHATRTYFVTAIQLWVQCKFVKSLKSQRYNVLNTMLNCTTPWCSVAQCSRCIQYTVVQHTTEQFCLHHQRCTGMTFTESSHNCV